MKINYLILGSSIFLLLPSLCFSGNVSKEELVNKLTTYNGDKEKLIKEIKERKYQTGFHMMKRVREMIKDQAMLKKVKLPDVFWSKFDKLYGDYLKKASANTIDKEKYIELWNSYILKRLNQKDLEEAVKFFSSDAGKAYVDAEKKANLERNTEVRLKIMQRDQELYGIMNGKLNKLLHKYGMQ